MLNQNSLAAALNQWRHWSLPIESEPVVLERLSTGRTNQSYLLQAGDFLMVLRLEPSNSSALGIDREFERQVLASLRDELCAKLIYSDPSQHYSVFEYVKGRVWTQEDLKSTDQMAKLESAIINIQEAKISGSKFDYILYLQQYQNQLIQKKIAPSLMRLEAYSAFLVEFEGFLSKEWKPVLCHHDLNPDNIIETSDGLKIIDWEYARLGHPDFDRRFIRSLLSANVEAGLQGDAMDKLIYWLDYYWGLVRE